MKLTLLILFLSFMHLSASVYSQQTRLNVDLQNVSIRDVLKIIEEQSEFFFLYTNEDVDVNRKVSIETKNETIENILNHIFDGSGVRYKVADRQIVLVKGENSDFFSLSQQQKTITGQVTSSNGESLPGVTVVIQGTTNGTITDANGNYTLSNITSDQTLVFSFVGMKTVEIPVQGKTVINAVMEEESIGLEEVVAVGYGTMKKSDLTGSVGIISAEELTSRSVTSIEEGLQGRLAGVAITQNSSAPGGGISVKIRGNTSILNGSEPLYVIDGFPVTGQSQFNTNAGRGLDSSTGTDYTVDQNPLAALNPSDIESIEVLKDASAAAIYGVRGANGVILITTKRGKKGAPKISYDTYVGVQTAAKKIDMMGAEDYMRIYNVQETNGGFPAIFSDELINNPPYDTDWQSLVLKDAIIHNHQLGVSGGSDAVQYNLSGGFFSQDGIVKGSEFERYSLRANLDVNVSEKFKIGNSLNVSRSVNNAARTEGESTNGVMIVALRMSPLLPIYQPDGTYSSNRFMAQYDVPDSQGAENPVAIINEMMDETVNTRILGTLFGEYSFTEDLKLKVSLGADIEQRDRHVYLSSRYNNENAISEANVSLVNRKSLLNENILSYNKTFDDIHTLSALVGFTVQKEDEEYRGITARGFATDITGPYDLGGGSVVPSVQSGIAEFNIVSFLGRLNYNYDDRYLVTVTGRRDGSSKFAADHKWAFFPSAAFAWRINNESFMEDLSTINNLKLRVGYGVVGNQELPTYQSLALLQSTNYNFGDGTIVSGFSPFRVAVPNLTWELTAQTNFGLDLSINDSKFNFSLDYYIKKTKDLLVQFNLPETSGIVESTVQNLGEMDNIGFEFSADGLLISQPDFSWKLGVNFSTNKNEITSLGDQNLYGDLSFIVPQPTYAGSTVRSYVRLGEPIGVFWGYKTDGLYRTQAEADADQGVNEGVEPGMVRYVDTNDDGSIDDEDRVVLGSPFPDFIYGISNNIQYKDFELRFFLQGQVGGDVYNMMRTFATQISRGQNVLEEMNDYWTTENVDAKCKSSDYRCTS